MADKKLLNDEENENVTGGVNIAIAPASLTNNSRGSASLTNNSLTNRSLINNSLENGSLINLSLTNDNLTNGSLTNSSLTNEAAKSLTNKGNNIKSDFLERNNKI